MDERGDKKGINNKFQIKLQKKKNVIPFLAA